MDVSFASCKSRVTGTHAPTSGVGIDRLTGPGLDGESMRGKARSRFGMSTFSVLQVHGIRSADRCVCVPGRMVGVNDGV